MKEIILVTLAFTFSLLTGKELDDEEQFLQELGYKKDHLDFVREQITKRINAA